MLRSVYNRGSVNSSGHSHQLYTASIFNECKISNFVRASVALPRFLGHTFFNAEFPFAGIINFQKRRVIR